MCPLRDDCLVVQSIFGHNTGLITGLIQTSRAILANKRGREGGEGGREGRREESEGGRRRRAGKRKDDQPYLTFLKHKYC